MVYVVLAGVVVVSLLAIAIVGSDAWIVPVFVIPIVALYAMYDRALRARERRHASPSEGSDVRHA
jgi:hypothetical protein